MLLMFLLHILLKLYLDRSTVNDSYTITAMYKRSFIPTFDGTVLNTIDVNTEDGQSSELQHVAKKRKKTDNHRQNTCNKENNQHLSTLICDNNERLSYTPQRKQKNKPLISTVGPVNCITLR